MRGQVKSTSSECGREKKKSKSSEMWKMYKMKRSDTDVIGISEGDEREHVAEALFEETKARNSPDTMIQINPQIQEAQDI